MIFEGDCREVMRTLDANSVDAIVTDPPYELGFMGKGWDRTGIAYDIVVWTEALRVLKPGGHLLAFGGTRTEHRMTCAIEDAGFQIRDKVFYCYGSGFPKSRDVSKAIDAEAGAQGTFGAPKTAVHAGWIKRGRMRADGGHEGYQRPWMASPDAVDKNARQYEPSTEAAREWQGWGTALKPAHEPIVMARKPLAAGTVASNVMQFGTGALNIDGCRIEGRERTEYGLANASRSKVSTYGEPSLSADFDSSKGRWPANLIHDGSEEVEATFAAQSKETISRGGQASKPQGYGEFGGGSRQIEKRDPGYGDTGTASRFFYAAKASRQERWKHIVCRCLSQVISPDSPVYDLKHCPLCGDAFKITAHPTQKPESLMRYLCRLITPPGGTVLDPFAGSGSTGRGAILEGFNFIGCELSPEYADIARHRIKAAMNRAQNPTTDPDQLTLWNEGANHD